VSSGDWSGIVPTYIHSLSEVLTQLNAKIAELEQKQGQIKEALSRNVNPSVNSVALQQVSESLAAAQCAKSGLEDSCCSSQSCNIVWADN
jgi:hypothetical protein